MVNETFERRSLVQLLEQLRVIVIYGIGRLTVTMASLALTVHTAIRTTELFTSLTGSWGVVEVITDSDNSADAGTLRVA
jgi:hypothetical protein